MAGRATYSEQDEARIYVALQAHEGNIKRTARETGIPESTVRRFRNKWAQEGPPKLEDVAEAVNDFVEDASRVRRKALALIESKIDAGEGKIAELTTTVGVLDDKIARAKGLATQRVEHQHALPPADEIRDALAAVFQGALDAARTRTREIADAEVVVELPPAS